MLGPDDSNDSTYSSLTSITGSRQMATFTDAELCMPYMYTESPLGHGEHDEQHVSPVHDSPLPGVWELTNISDGWPSLKSTPAPSQHGARKKRTSASSDLASLDLVVTQQAHNSHPQEIPV
eukprot:COSAG01_NODE_7112_length_3346_cov_3.335694_2_plen_121_part_00